MRLLSYTLNNDVGQIWTNPNVGLKKEFKNLTQLQLSLSTVNFFKLHFNPTFGFDPI